MPWKLCEVINEKAQHQPGSLFARSQMPLANGIVLERRDKGVTGRYEKPGAGPGL